MSFENSIDLDPDMLPLTQRDPSAPTFKTAGPAVMRPVMAYISPRGGPELAAIRDIKLNGRPARDYRPGDDPRATIALYHGGGWSVGSIDDYDSFARTLAKELDARVLSVDYRLAPEHPFPAAVDDAWTALCGIDPHGPLFVAGDSAGGNLSAVMAQLARDKGGPAIAGQILIYPSTVADVTAPAMKAFKPPFLTLEDIETMCQWYAPDPSTRTDPRYAPLHGNVNGLPPAIVVTAGADLLCAEGRAYAEKLRKAGVPVAEHHEPNALHGYFTLLPEARATRATIAAIRRFVDSIVETAR